MTWAAGALPSTHPVTWLPLLLFFSLVHELFPDTFLGSNSSEQGVAFLDAREAFLPLKAAWMYFAVCCKASRLGDKSLNCNLSSFEKEYIFLNGHCGCWENLGSVNCRDQC